MPTRIGSNPPPVSIAPTQPQSPAAPARPGVAPSPADRFVGTEPLVRSAEMFGKRTSAQIDSIRMVSTPGDRWNAELDVPLSALNLGGATLTQITLPGPWHDEAQPGEALPFTVQNGVLHITVPNAIPSKQTWGGQVSPAFEVHSSDGMATLLEVTPRQLLRDTTLEKKEGLESQVTSLQSQLERLQGIQAKVKAYLGDTSRVDLEPTDTFISGQPYPVYAAGQLKDAQADLADVAGRLGQATKLVQARFDGASPAQQQVALTEAASLSGNAALDKQLIETGNAAVAANQQVANLQGNVDALTGLVSRDELASMQAQLADAKTAASAAEATRDAAMKQALSSLSPDTVLAAADVTLGTGQDLRSLQTQRDSAGRNVTLWQGIVAGDRQRGIQIANDELPQLAKQIDEANAQMAGAKAQLANLTPELASENVR